MIKDVSELLLALAKAEAVRLAQVDVSHPGTIGDMYEGLTKDLLGRAIPTNLGLQIVDGFVTDGTGQNSAQIDCMLVTGKGEPVPYKPGTYIWHVSNVVAVFEIKKQLFSSQMSDGYEKMRTVSERYSAWIQSPQTNAKVNIDAALRMFGKVVGEMAPYPDQWADMPTDQHLIMHSMMFDQLAPLRIVFGYDGFKSERNFREGFLDFLGGKVQQLGYGVPTIPNLMISSEFSLIKLNGHPYASPLVEDGKWPILASSRLNPILLLLEVVWTRLSYIQNMPELFGEDLDEERFSLLLLAKPKPNPDEKRGGWGWIFSSVSATERELATLDTTHAWSPTTITITQKVVLDRLCREGEIDTTDQEFVEFLEKERYGVDEFVSELVSTTLVAKRGNSIELTTTELGIVVLPDGRFVAGENNTGRLQRWVQKFMANWHSK